MSARSPQVPGYELRAQLGGGPTCDVFAAIAANNRKYCALKVLRDEAADDATNVQLLTREADAGQSVQHPNLVRILHAAIGGARPFHIVMDLVRGRSLRSVLRQHHWLTAKQVAGMGRQIAGALATLHAAGYVHGDVKPDNLHLGAERHATLLDLGFAHRPGVDVGLVGAGFVLGTANYVAPELCEQPDNDGPEADIFSLGVTLFELLTGALPYPDGEVEQIMVSHRDDDADSLWNWKGQWPVGFAALIDRMLARDPAERPTAEQVEQELAGLYPALERGPVPVRRSA